MNKLLSKIKSSKMDDQIKQLLDYENRIWETNGVRDYIDAEYVEKNREGLERMINYFVAYPDKFMDAITPDDTNFNLYFYQRIFLRVCMRHRYVFSTFTRAFSKSFLAILSMVIRAILLPNSKLFICTKVKEQAAKIAREKLDEIFLTWPLLAKEIYRGKDRGPLGEHSSFQADYIELRFKNNSIFSVVGMANSTRGGRKHAGVIEEVRDIDGKVMDEVILPMMNIVRKDGSGRVNPNEPHQGQLYVTTAGEKSTYAYSKMVELLLNTALKPDDYFVWAGTYDIPVMHGLLDAKFIDEIKLDSTFDDNSFAREYMSIWTGGSKDSFFNFERLMKHRTIVTPDWKYKIPLTSHKDTFYLLAIDVARLTAQTVVSVFKVSPRDNYFIKKLVNIFVMDQKSMHFSKQADKIKAFAEIFRTDYVVVDGAGLGVGLIDFLIIDTVGDDGVLRGPLGIAPGKYAEAYKDLVPCDAKKIIYIIKSNKEAGEIHQNALSQISTGKVEFLVSDREAKARLMSKQVGKDMLISERNAALMPFQMTTVLHEEMANLKTKGITQAIQVEQINKNIGKDKFSSMEYGLWQIKQIEEEYFKNKRRGSSGLSDFFFVN